MDGVKVQMTGLALLTSLVRSQQVSSNIFPSSLLEDGLETQKQSSNFQSLLGKLSNPPSDSFLTSFNSPSSSFGTLGSPFGSTNSNSSRTTVASTQPSSSPSFFPSKLPVSTTTKSSPSTFPDLDPDLSSLLPALLNAMSNNPKPLSPPTLQQDRPRSSQQETPRSSQNEIAALDAEISSLDTLISTVRQLAQQQAALPMTPGGVDFSQATRTADGRLCVIKQETVETVSKDPVLECTHKNVEKCHYTYLTQFTPAQEEQCEENFEKSCQITFRQEAVQSSVRKCYRPLRKVCNNQGPEECRTVYESSCSTRYVEQEDGKFVGNTSCQKLPVEVCGQGCVTEEGPEECHDKQVDSLVDVPEETCDLNPQKTCRLVTRLVPSLSPREECTRVPQETCSLKFSAPRVERKPLQTEWCLDEDDIESGSLSQSQPQPQSQFQPQPQPAQPFQSIRPRNPPPSNLPSPQFEFPQDSLGTVEEPGVQVLSDYRAAQELRRFKRLGLV